MANLWLIVTGLGVLVEKEADRSAPFTILMKRVFWNDQVAGKNIPPHEPTFRRKPTGASILIGDRDVRLFPPTAGSPKIEGDKKLLLPVGDKLDKAEEVKPLYTGPRTPGSLPKVARIFLEGGSVRPIHVDRNFDLRRLSLETKIELVAMHDLKTGKRLEKEHRSIANGLLYWRSIADQEGDPYVELGDEKFFLEPIPPEGTGNLPLPNDQKNYVVWATNTADEHFSPSDKDFDRDFDLLYDFLADGALTRYVPETTGRPTAVGDSNPPGQCMYGYAIG